MRNARWIIALVIAAAAVVTYFGRTSVNPITGETQRVAMSPEQEVAIGLKSAPQMAAQMGGLSKNADAAAVVRKVDRKKGSGPFSLSRRVKYSKRVLTPFPLCPD